jgi:hypothetical protein
LISALKSQQFRWTKGGAETARKNFKALITSQLPMSVKLHGAFHLIYSFGFISIILYSFLTVPLLFVKEYYPQFNLLFKLSGVIAIPFLIYLIHYFISYWKNTVGSPGKKTLGFIFYFPLFVSLFIGLSLSNATGILQGYLGIKSGFIRTPKFNIINSVKIIKSNYAVFKINWLTILEGLLIFYFLFGLVQAFYFENYDSIPLLLMAFTGFAMVFILSLVERSRNIPSA